MCVCVCVCVCVPYWGLYLNLRICITVGPVNGVTIRTHVTVCMYVCVYVHTTCTDVLYVSTILVSHICYVYVHRV